MIFNKLKKNRQELRNLQDKIEFKKKELDRWNALIEDRYNHFVKITSALSALSVTVPYKKASLLVKDVAERDLPQYEKYKLVTEALGAMAVTMPYSKLLSLLEDKKEEKDESDFINFSYLY